MAVESDYATAHLVGGLPRHPDFRARGARLDVGDPRPAPPPAPPSPVSVDHRLVCSLSIGLTVSLPTCAGCSVQSNNEPSFSDPFGHSTAVLGIRLALSKERVRTNHAPATSTILL